MAGGSQAKVAIPTGLLSTLYPRTPHAIHTLHCFDFDGTLIQTPTPTLGKALYSKRINKPWPHKGWWGRVESLQPPVISYPLSPDLVIQEPYRIWRRILGGDLAGHAAYVATGRIGEKFHGEVIKVLASCKKWDTSEEELWKRGELKLKEGWEDGVCCYPGLKIKVDEWKMGLVEELVRAVEPRVKKVVMWEDREEHVERFEKVLEGRLRELGVQLTVKWIGPAHMN